MKESSQNFLTQRKRQIRTPFLLKPSPTSHHLPQLPPTRRRRRLVFFYKTIGWTDGQTILGKFFDFFCSKLQIFFYFCGKAFLRSAIKSKNFATQGVEKPFFNHIRLMIPNTYEIREFLLKICQNIRVFGKIFKKITKFSKKVHQFS